MTKDVWESIKDNIHNLESKELCDIEHALCVCEEWEGVDDAMRIVGRELNQRPWLSWAIHRTGQMYRLMPPRLLKKTEDNTDVQTPTKVST